MKREKEWKKERKSAGVGASPSEKLQRELLSQHHLIINFFGGDETHKWFGLIEFDECQDFFFAGEGKHEDAVLEFVKPDGLQVRPEDIAEFLVLLGDIEKSDAPQFVPMLWLLNLYTEELAESGLTPSFDCQQERNGTIRIFPFSDQFEMIQETDGPVKILPIDLLPLLSGEFQYTKALIW